MNASTQMTAPDFIVRLIPSKTALVLAFIFHTLFVFVCLYYFPFKILSASFTVAHFAYTLYQSGWLSNPKTIRQIHVHPTNRITLTFRKTPDVAEAILLDSSVLTRFVGVLHFRMNGHIYRVSVFPDSTDKEHYRKLVVYARWHRKQPIQINPSPFEG